jgi:hypothetical protein
MLYKTLAFYTIDIAAARGAIQESSIQQLKSIAGIKGQLNENKYR